MAKQTNACQVSVTVEERERREREERKERGEGGEGEREDT